MSRPSLDCFCHPGSHIKVAIHNFFGKKNEQVIEQVDIEQVDKT